MCHYSHTATAALPAADVFAYLADVRHLPEFFPNLVSAEPVADSSEVAVETEVDGERVAERAWLLVDNENRSLRWGADSPNEHHGTLRVSDTGAGECTIEVSVHTSRDAVPEIQAGLETTIAMVTQAVAAA